ncbi:hypothetical protein HCA58_12965 [Micromonospora sp. HNM0581]|uniref:hypothetical protein n=1 Tax=Micromonospora sp. HNM0581 TaxID=2716341 RepID=UPI00146E6625|nr:hypothetical protein [Micromonospora sp. HNM0581]
MTGVNGWYSANCRMPAPIDSAGTNALLRKGDMISGTVAMPADSTVLARDVHDLETIDDAFGHPCSVRAGQGEGRPCGDIEVDAIEGHLVAVALTQP